MRGVSQRVQNSKEFGWLGHRTNQYPASLSLRRVEPSNTQTGGRDATLQPEQWWGNKNVWHPLDVMIYYLC